MRVGIADACARGDADAPITEEPRREHGEPVSRVVFSGDRRRVIVGPIPGYSGVTFFRQPNSTRGMKQMSNEVELAPSTVRDVEPLTELLAGFGASHTKLDLDLAYVEKLASAVFDRDAASRAAAETVMLRSLEVSELRDALGRVAAAVDDPHVEELLSPQTSLAKFVQGLYRWADSVVEALIDFAASALRGSPAWDVYDARIAHLARLPLHVLTERIRDEAGAFGIFSEFAETLDELFWAAWYLHASMGGKSAKSSVAAERSRSHSEG